MKVNSGASIGFELSRWKDGAECKSTNESMEASLEIISRSVFAQADESFINDGGTDVGFPKLENIQKQIM